MIKGHIKAIIRRIKYIFSRQYQKQRAIDKLFSSKKQY